MKKSIKGKDPYLTMYEAIAKYIESKGGTAAVVGGVSIGREYGSLPYKYFIQVEIVGRIPKHSFPSPKPPKRKKINKK